MSRRLSHARVTPYFLQKKAEQNTRPKWIQLFVVEPILLNAVNIKSSAYFCLYYITKKMHRAGKLRKASLKIEHLLLPLGTSSCEHLRVVSTPSTAPLIYTRFSGSMLLGRTDSSVC